MSNYDKLKDTLTEIFEIDKADLDFGIYRIMNQKREQVMDFINNRLPKDIKDILAQTQSKDGVTLQAELEKMGRSLDDAGVLREDSPKYLSLKAQLTASIDTNALEQEVFSHLASFFKRYYKEGDFISMRRYKKDVYAIPYEGEEVKLHWANHDQYYIKTSEYLKNYSFKLKDGKLVHFRLKEASTEQNNNKTQGDAERRFAIYEEQPLEVENSELFINFTYEPHKKTVKQSDLAFAAVKTIEQGLPGEFAALFDKAPTEANKTRTILDKHLADFISRNSFDYFIHKDLGGFLRRELDFYIKNEVLFIDDINTENPAFFTAQLSKIKAVKTVACKIIDFLAQVEDFQKKLWLKKKLVTSTHYLITLDRVPETYYAEIAANEEQWIEWKRLFGISPETLSVENEKTKFLPLDTRFFSEDFKERLLSEFDDLDAQTNGLLLNSENFQALNLLQEKYKEQVKTIYIDPPYNTNSSPVIYKNEYKHSSWNSLMSDRISLSQFLSKKTGFHFVAIDHAELFNLGKITDSLFAEENRIAIVAIQHNPKGRNQAEFFSENFDYMLCYAQNKSSTKFNLVAIDEEVLATFTEQDEEGKYRWENFIRARTSWSKENKPNNWYPLYVNVDQNKVSDEKLEGYEEVYPKTSTGNFSWKSIKSSFKDQNKDGFFRIVIEDGKVVIQHKYREQQVLKNFWLQKKYQSEFNGTNLLKDILGKSLFSFPKSIFTVLDTLKITVNSKDIILDYFAGSGTTGHATIKLNRGDGGKRKYMLVEMGTYFNTVTKPRIAKVIYSDNWKGGLPQDAKGISQLVKYQSLESYEDVLNNLVLQSKDAVNLFSESAKEQYQLRYMLDLESREHLFDIGMFRNPFNYTINTTQANEQVPTVVDLLETFNYLIGLYVQRQQRVKDEKRDIKLVEGKTREGKKTLVIWRNLENTSNEETQSVFRKLYDSTRSAEFNQIFINGDHHFENTRQGEESFKVKGIEEEFFKRMFE